VLRAGQAENDVVLRFQQRAGWRQIGRREKSADIANLVLQSV
jgi:hypothetical protein